MGLIQWLQNLPKKLNSLLNPLPELYNAGRYEEAIPIAEQTRKIIVQIWGANNPRVAYINSWLASLYQEQNRLAEAEPLYLEAIDIVRKALPKGHPSLATHLNNLASLYHLQNRLAEAERLYLEAIEIIRKALPKDHPSLVTHLNNLASLYHLQNRLAEAERLYLESIDIDRNALPKDHPSLATHLNNLAGLYHLQNRLAEAERLYLESIDIDRNALPKDHPSLATHLNSLGFLYYSQNRLAEAETLYLESIDIDRNALPKDHPSLATHLNNLASLYHLQNRLAEAERLYLEAIDIDRNALPKDHPELAKHLNNLALLYTSQNRLAEAERLYLEAIDIDRKALPKDHPELAKHLNNLAELYKTQNRLAEAERLYLESIDIDRNALPKDHPELAKHLNNLALLYTSQNRLAEAEPLYLQAIDINRKALPKNHPYLAFHLNNLASLYYLQNRLAEAQPLYLQAIDINRKALPKGHPELAKNLNNLAGLYQRQNRLAEAERLYLEAIDIDRKALPKDHPELALHLNNLAGLYQKQNRLTEAEKLYLEAIDIDRKALPKDHPQLANHLNNLALLLAKTDRPLAAFKLMLQASKIDETNIQRYFGSSSESDRLAYLQSIRHRFEKFLSLIYQHLPHQNAAKQAALNLVLKRKALTAAAQAAFNSAILAGRYPHLEGTFQQWRKLSDKLLQLSYDIPSPEDVAPRREELARVQKQCNDLERQLAREVPEIRLQEQTCDRKAVALCLPAGASLVEFVRFRVWNFQEDRWQDARYLAFILPAGQPGQVEMVDLGDAAELDKLISQYREALVTRDDSANLEMWDEASAESQSAPPPKLHLYNQNAGCQLREAVFDKLRPFLGSCRNLILAPDGDLNLAPLGILPLEDGDRTLRDEYAINSVSSGRELLRNSMDLERQPGPALTVGAPNYDLGSSGGNGGSAGDSDKLAVTLADMPFRHIPETGDLAAAVAQRLDAKALLGDDALVAELLARRSPKVLLVATHGFFFQKRGPQDYYQLVNALLRCPNGEEEKILKRHEQLLDKELLEVMAEVATQLAEKDDEEAANRLRQFAELLEDEINDTAPPPDSVYRLDAKVEDPMLRSGIALAGANTWSWGRELPPEAGSGVMFARDVAALDLLATELVILVACQSGLGEVATGEGVFGLRRAVAVAGAKNLIMSLWSVPAYATILLMERLFDYIDAGWQPAEALEMAQDYIKNVTVGELHQSELGETILRDLGIFIGITTKTHPLEMKPLEHPYYWAAWVCQGVNE